MCKPRGRIYAKRILWIVQFRGRATNLLVFDFKKAIIFAGLIFLGKLQDARLATDWTDVFTFLVTSKLCLDTKYNVTVHFYKCFRDKTKNRLCRKVDDSSNWGRQLWDTCCWSCFAEGLSMLASRLRVVQKKFESVVWKNTSTYHAQFRKAWAYIMLLLSISQSEDQDYQA